MIDIYLLRALRNKEQYTKLFGLVPDTIEKRTLAILKDYGKYFHMFKEHDTVDLALFIPQFERWHPGMDDETKAVYTAVLKSAAKPVPEDVRDSLANWLIELTLATKIANITARYDDGDVSDISGEIDRVFTEFKNMRSSQRAVFLDMEEIDDFYKEGAEAGVTSRLQCLRDTIRPFKGGDFGIIAGRPDAGKTGYVISEMVHMAPQLPMERPVLWMNNESKSDNLRIRLYQSALSMTATELKANTRQNNIDMYRKALGGRTDRIKLIDIHGWHIGQVDRLMDDTRPGIVVFDMIDHIKGFGNEARTDLALEEMYKWAREKCVEYDCVGFATSQISGDGDGMMFPLQHMLKDSKTGKQGACDFIIMVGKSNDKGFDGQRFIGMPKNKLSLDGAPKDPQATVMFNPSKSLYSDVPIGFELADPTDGPPGHKG